MQFISNDELLSFCSPLTLRQRTRKDLGRKNSTELNIWSNATGSGSPSPAARAQLRPARASLETDHIFATSS